MTKILSKEDFSFQVQLVFQVWKKRFNGRLPDPNSKSFTAEINQIRDEIQKVFPSAFRSGVNEGKGLQDNIRAILSGVLEVKKAPTDRTIEVLSSYLFDFKPEKLDKWQKTFGAEMPYWNHFKSQLMANCMAVNSDDANHSTALNAVNQVQFEEGPAQPKVDGFSKEDRDVVALKATRFKLKMLASFNIAILILLAMIYLTDPNYYNWVFYTPDSTVPKHNLWVAVYHYKNTSGSDTTIYAYNTFRNYRTIEHVRNYFYSTEIGDDHAFMFLDPLQTRPLKGVSTTRAFADEHGGKPPLVYKLQGI